MKTTLGVVLAIAVAVGIFVAHRSGAHPSHNLVRAMAHDPLAARGEAPPAQRIPRQPRIPVIQVRATPSSTGAESRPPHLPLSTAEVPITPELDSAYQELKKTFGPGVMTWIDGKLARRAELAKCGIDEPGAAKFVLRSRVDFKTGTQKVEELVSITTSYEGEMNDIVVDCIRKAVVGKVEKHVSEVPAWFNDEQRRDWQDSPLDHEIDTVGFPIENDELYQLFNTGRASAYQETETKTRYGWK